ncbi:hypothetical protein CEXT_150091 [Caerostris extrusa]|uniref:Uncharacterized protein n=1 Tax=Caerostris extrusa TaxID=172846 RepID=A0AAV4W6R3_CAEEX|nr:hypothetical protein CEXT_150091 [Caerostris extrusa]
MPNETIQTVQCIGKTGEGFLTLERENKNQTIIEKCTPVARILRPLHSFIVCPFHPSPPLRPRAELFSQALACQREDELELLVLEQFFSSFPWMVCLCVVVFIDFNKNFCEKVFVLIVFHYDQLFLG